MSLANKKWQISGMHAARIYVGRLIRVQNAFKFDLIGHFSCPHFRVSAEFYSTHAMMPWCYQVAVFCITLCKLATWVTMHKSKVPISLRIENHLKVALRLDLSHFLHWSWSCMGQQIHQINTVNHCMRYCEISAPF